MLGCGGSAWIRESNIQEATVFCERSGSARERRIALYKSDQQAVLLIEVLLYVHRNLDFHTAPETDGTVYTSSSLFDREVGGAGDDNPRDPCNTSIGLRALPGERLGKRRCHGNS